MEWKLIFKLWTLLSHAFQEGPPAERWVLGLLVWGSHTAGHGAAPSRAHEGRAIHTPPGQGTHSLAFPRVKWCSDVQTREDRGLGGTDPLISVTGIGVLGIPPWGALNPGLVKPCSCHVEEMSQELLRKTASFHGLGQIV